MQYCSGYCTEKTPPPPLLTRSLGIDVHTCSPSSYQLRKETCYKPKIITLLFYHNSSINRLVFKYELAHSSYRL